MTRVTVTVGTEVLTIDVPPADAVLLDSLAGSSDNAKLGNAAGRSVVVPAGVRRMSDMAYPTGYPVYGWFMQKVLAFLGAGVDQTVFELAAGSLSQAWAKVAGGKRIEDLVDYSETNPYYVMRAGEGLKDLGGFTLRGTNQGTNPKTGLPYCYNGLVFYKPSGSRLHHFKVEKIPADTSYPPRETFPVNLFQVGADGVVVEDGEVAGGGTALTATGATTAGPVELNRVYAHDLKGHGWSSFQLTAQSFRSADVKVRNAKSVYNFERWRGGPVTLIRPDFDATVNATVILDSDERSTPVVIRDPVGRPRVLIHQTYVYPPRDNPPANKQRRSDVTVMVGETVRNDLIDWMGGGGI